MLTINPYQNVGNFNQNQNQRVSRKNIAFMAWQKTCFIIKPDAFERKLEQPIANYVLNGLKVKNVKLKKWPRKIMEAHYSDKSERSFFKPLISYMTRGKAAAYEVEGEDAVSVVRNRCFNVRDEYGSLVDGENLVHSSDSVANAQIELPRFFPNKK